jgi:chromosome segregation ATPase
MKDDYTGALLEDIQDRIKKFAEAMSDVPGDVAQLKTDVAELKDDVKVITAAVKDQTGQLDDHEERITTLEAV